MSSIALSCLFALLASVSAAEPQDERERARQLLNDAEKLNKEGKTDEARPLLAEAWAITANVYWEQGNLTAAGEAWRLAVRFGWTGESPETKAVPLPKPTDPTRSTPPAAPKAQEPPPPDNVTPGFETRRRVVAERRGKRMQWDDIWEQFALAPYDGPRANGWHGLYNTPPLEAASVIPAEMHHMRFIVDLASTEFTDSSQGGPTNWDAVAATEHIEYNYGLTDTIQIGGRLSLGELLDGGGDPVTVFDGGTQIIPTGSRSFGLESLVLRGKWVVESDFVNWGVLSEFKIPLADEDDYLTAQTFDIGVSGLLSKRWESWAAHLNLGFVLPIGDPEIFEPDPDADTYFHGGIGVSFFAGEQVTFLGQVEFNTSAFGDVTVLDEPVTVLNLGMKYRMTKSVYAGFTLGTGLTDESGNLYASGGVDVLF